MIGRTNAGGGGSVPGTVDVSIYGSAVSELTCTYIDSFGQTASMSGVQAMNLSVTSGTALVFYTPTRPSYFVYNDGAAPAVPMTTVGDYYYYTFAVPVDETYKRGGRLDINTRD